VPRSGTVLEPGWERIPNQVRPLEVAPRAHVGIVEIDSDIEGTAGFQRGDTGDLQPATTCFAMPCIPLRKVSTQI